MLKESCVFVNDQRLRGAHWGLPSSFELRASHDARRVFWTFTVTGRKEIRAVVARLTVRCLVTSQNDPKKGNALTLRKT